MPQVHTTLSGLTDRFQIISELGSGATGSVFHARDLVLNRAVAIKVLHAGVDPGAIARFQREAQATSKLNHPNLVHILDFGVDSTSKPYLVMEYLPGKDLKAIIERERKLPLDRVIAIAIQLCHALSHAHEKGVFHRDVKPSNIIVQVIEGNESVKLVDFGLAKVLGTSQSLTAPGATIGTVYYLSPEAISGKETDARSDIYALGCVLFECLTGHPPFQGDTAHSTLLKHVNDPIPGFGKGRESIPAHVKSIIAKALAKEPNDRYQTASALKEEFEHYLSETSEDAIDGLPVDDKKPHDTSKSPRAVYAIVAALLFVLIAIAFGITLQSQNVQNTAVTKSVRINKSKPEAEKAAEVSIEAQLKDVPPADFVDFLKKSNTIFIGAHDIDSSIVADVINEPVTRLRVKDRLISTELLNAILKKDKLAKVEFQNCRGITDESLTKISKSKTIKNLVLTTMHLNDSSLRPIAQLSNLETLEIDSNPAVTGTGFKYLTNHKTLFRLSIGDTGVTAANLRWLLDNAPEHLRNIRPANLNLHDKDVRSLNLRAIRTLFLSGNPITIKSIDYIATFPNLTYLHLTNCQNLDDSCLVPLSKLKLQALSLSRTKVSNLSGLRKMKQLHELYLEDCSFLTDKAMEELTGLHLDKLNLSKTNITDAGLKVLATIKPNKFSYVSVSITDCPNITKNSLDWLKSLRHVMLSKRVIYE